MAEQLGDGISLQGLFNKGMSIQRKSENDEINVTSISGKGSIEEGIKCLEQATHLVNQLSLFSKNEGLEDVTTSNLKFLLLPALLGDLTMQSMGDDRLEDIQKARVYFVDYLQRVKSYSITSEGVPTEKDAASAAEGPPLRSNYERLAAERTAKIQRYKEQKELEKKLKDLSTRLESSEAASDHHGDDDVAREHIITLLKLWAIRCRDHISSIDQEVPLLQEMERRKKDGGRNLQSEAAARESPPPKPKSRKPIVITREMLQAQVFGAGYPSLPAMSVEEFYEQKYKEQMEARAQEGFDVERKMKDLSVVGAGRDEEGGALDGENEKEEDEDSVEALKKAREWDDYKDDHRTGWGNKKNMG